MTEQKKLRELANNIRVVGTLKEKNLEIKPNKKDPSVKQIMGSIVVEVVDGDKINEIEVNLFAKESSKLYKGYLTIYKEFKALSDFPREEASRVSVVGSVDENVYAGQDGELRKFNRFRGLFVNRIEDKDLARDASLAKDSAVAQVELLINNIRQKTDNEGVETGELSIEAMTVGYNNGVHELHGIVVGEDLADVIEQNYEVGNTGLLTFAINNYVIVEEQKEEDPFASQSGGFGVQVDISSGPIKKYVRELRVIGGLPPYFDERALEDEDITLAKQIHGLKLQEALNNVPSTPPVATATGGFGVNSTDPFAADSPKIDLSDDDLPF